MTTERTTTNRAIYGRGFRDGVRSAQAEGLQKRTEEHMMNEARFNAVFNGLTSIAKKVYEAVPISEPWDTKAIVNELNRSGSRPDLNIIGGCLNTLVHAGLIQETDPKTFIRVPVKPKPQREPKPSQESTANSGDEPMAIKPAPALPQAGKPPNDILEKMSALAGRVNHVRSYLEQLSSDIETTALEIEEQMAQREKDMAKLRQLQALLKDLTPA